ncbi:MAG: S9 family peptidase, partial [Blastocatellia bacterium]|nr:S9 family peptidase [Blastocatellia bacterium]
MKSSIKIATIFLSLIILIPSASGQAKRPLSFDDLIKIKRVADAQISPDGKYVAYVVNAIDKNANRGKRIIGISTTAGAAETRWISSAGNNDTPRWSRDGKYLAFLSSREGAPQIYLAEAQSLLTGAGSDNARKITGLPEGVADFVWSPDGKMFALTTDVYPDCKDLKCVAEKSEAAEKNPVKAVIADRLLFRHWNSFKRGKRSHLFVAPVDGGDPRDLTPGDYDVPPFSLGDPTAYDFSPDGQEIVFARNTEKVEAASTNNDLFLVSVNGGEARRITGNNPGSDTTPRYSPDGRWIAYRSQARNGYESDRFRLMLYDRKTGAVKELSTGFDRWVGEVVWAPDSRGIFIVAEDRGRTMIGIASIEGGIKPLIEKMASDGLTISGDGKTLAFTRSSMTRPAEVFWANADGSGVTQLTRTNDELMAQLDLNAAEDFEYSGALKSRIHGFIVKPPQFDSSKKYPLALLIHGGPQGAWLDNWGYRWNPQMWAARGYVTVLINPHGSTGYGQAFTEEISGDWGGAAYEDLMKGVDYVLKLGYVDPARLGAAGGSFGGYMIDWILGHTDRFKALVTHDGVYNLTSMYGATEELWFPEWEFKGNPWDNPELYSKWSPNRFVKNFKTPTLVIHGELDYRVPVGEGLQLFTALQRRGVPSKLLYFPDEGHWVLKPQNSELWYKTVLDWFDQWLK